MKAISICKDLCGYISKEKQTSKAVDYTTIGCCLVTLDRWTEGNPKDRMFGNAPTDEWEAPSWAKSIIQCQKVSVITNNVDIPDCGDREGYGEPQDITFTRDDGKQITVTVEPFENPEDLKSAFTMIAGYFKKPLGPTEKLSVLSGDAAITSVEVTNNLVNSEGLVPIAWDCDLPITLKEEYVPMFGDEHFLVKMRTTQIVRKLIDAIMAQ